MNHVDTPQSLCRFGVARGDITPPVGIYHRLWGAATHDRSTGVHRPLTATALVFQAQHGTLTEQTEQIVVAVDHCLLWAPEMEALLDLVTEKTGLARAQIVVAFSHTHSGGLLGMERLHLPGGDLIPPYLGELGRKLAALIEEGRHNVQPATIAHAAGRSSMAGNRDFWDEASQQYVCGFNPGGATDDTVLVARVTDAAGRLLATIVNYACHPTTLAWQNSLLSPDFCGGLREVVEQATGVPCAFLQGASGDQGPREGFVGDVAVADRNGRQLGYAVLAALESLPPPGTRFQYTGPVVSGATLGTWAHVPLDAAQLEQKSTWRLRRWQVSLPYRPELPTRAQLLADQKRYQAEEQAAQRVGQNQRARDCHALVERMTRWLTRIEVLPPHPTLSPSGGEGRVGLTVPSPPSPGGEGRVGLTVPSPPSPGGEGRVRGESFPLPVVLWQIGDALWLAVEGEHYNLLQRALRERFPGMPLIVTTLANGSRCTYLPTRDAYGKGIYQDSVALLAPGSLEHLIEAVGMQIEEWEANG